tara:strand:+ start:474 stop:989 length:516 start_codon:yes stop_codon:yes gene_type:complete
MSKEKRLEKRYKRKGKSYLKAQGSDKEKKREKKLDKAYDKLKAEQKAKGASMKKYGASKKDFPEIKEKNQGKFTKWVEKNMPGTDTCKAASKIMRSKTKKYSPAVVKMANYANNFGCKKDGASMDHSKKDGPKAGLFGGLVAEGKSKGMSESEAVKYAGKNIKQRAAEKKK